MEDIALAKQIIEEREYELWEPMWWTHEVDEWLYVLYYDDGKTNLTHKGKEAYETYCEDERIYLIMRKTKHLFPLWEVVLEPPPQEAKSKALAAKVNRIVFFINPFFA